MLGLPVSLKATYPLLDDSFTAMNPTKPDFSELPAKVQEDLLWDMELDYDGYDGSKANCIHDILNGNITSTHQLIIANYYRSLRPRSVAHTLASFRDHARDEASRAQELINRFPDQS